MKWSCAALVAVLLVRGAAFAADAPPAPPPPAPGPPVPAPGSPPAAPDAGAVAARVVAAFDARDDVALRALAASDAPDPWIVADLVLAQGRADAAEAFAKAAPRADVEGLPAYVASRRGVADAPARREALARANAALGAQRGDVALEAAGPRDEGPIADVVGVRLEMTRGFGHRLAGAPDAAEPAFLAVAEAAARIGWLAREGAALDEAGKAAYAAQRLDAARGAWTRMREVAERRGRRAAVAVASALVGDCSREMGDLPAAAAAIEAGLAAEADAPGALEAFGGPERLRTLHGRVLLDLGRFDAALAAYARALPAAEASGDPGWVAELLSGRAEARAQSGAVALAVADLERAVVLLEGTEHRAYLVTTRRRLGGVLRAAKEPAKALVVLQRCVADAEALGDPATLAAALGELAGAAVDLGDLAAANAALERGVAAYVAAHDAEGAFVLRRERVGVMATRGEGVRAQALVEAEIAAAEAAGDRGGAAAHLELLAALCQQLGDAARAEDALRRALASYEGSVAAGVPGATRALAEAFGAAAGLSEQAGRLLTARAQRERAIEAYDAAGDAAGAVGARVALALLETRLGDAKAAVARLEPLLATLPEGAGGDAVANVRQALATAWLAAGERAKAAALFEDVRRAHVAAGRVLDAIRARADLGQAFADAGEYGRAIEALAAARAEAEALPRPEPSVVAIIRARLGSTQYLAGFYPDALEHLEAARAAQVALGERVNAASSISNLGLVHAAFGQLDEAIRAHETGRAMQEAMGNRADAAASGFNIGQVLRRRGDLAKAVSWFERVEAEYAAMGRPADVATVLLVRASIAAMLDDPASSRALEARAIELLRGCGDTLGLELAELDAAGRALDDGDAAASLATYERAHAAEEARGARVSAAETLRFMGYALTELGRHAEALEAIERSRVAFEAIGDRRGVAQARQAAGLALEAKGDLAAARAAFEEALTLQDDLGDRPEAVGTLSFLARVQARAGAPAEAMDAARRCIDLAALTTRGLGAEEGVGGRRVIGLASAVGARAAVSVGDVAALLFFLESGRAGALLEGLEARETLWAAAVPAPLRAEEADARAAEALALAAFRRAADDGDRAAARAAKAEVEAARLRLSAAVARIQREAKAGADLLYPRTITLPALQGALAAGEAFVAYALLEGDAVALVVTPADARIVGLGPTKTIVETVEGLALDDASSDPAGGLAALASRVVGPLGLPPAVTRVLVSPSGALAHVPFAALLPDRTVAYAPSGTTHAFLRRDEGLRGEGVLALGDPAYDEGARSAGAVGRGGLRLVRLPGTAVEATALGTRVLLGPDATEPALVAALATRPRWRALHLACHGLVDPDRPAFSSLALTPSAGDDGLLTALEVFRTHVAADLVVLSACETGKGRIFEGEGLVGLARAFMFAGAPRVVCSLWKVDDDATRALMTRFYELWNPKPSSGAAPVPAAEALRQAQAFVRAQPRWKHPFYWAAWVLWGPPS